MGVIIGENSPLGAFFWKKCLLSDFCKTKLQIRVLLKYQVSRKTSSSANHVKCFALSNNNKRREA